MKVRFWGTRGSIPSPLGAREIQEKLYRAIRNLPKSLDTSDEAAVWSYINDLPTLVRGTAGGNTPCVSVQSGEDLLVLDAGTGLRELGLSLMRGPFGRGQGVVHLFISHLHWDHIQGFPMFVPAFIPGNQIRIYGFHDMRAAFEMQQNPLTWPVSLQYMSARIEFVPLTLGQPLTVGEVQIEALKNHHPGGSYSYRLSDGHGAVVYATDVEYKQLDDAAVQRYVRFFRRADVLIFDSQYTLREAWKKEDWGHSSALIGVDLARAAGVKRLFLFHHDPTYSDGDLERILEDAVAYQAEDPGRPGCEIGIALEGQEVDLGPERAIDWQLAPDGGTAILTSARVFDELSVELVARQLEAAGSSSIIDLSQVETLTTGGIKALVMLQQKQPGRALALVAPSERVRRVIRLTGYQDSFAVYPSVEAALAAVAAREAARLPGQVIGGRYQIEARLGENALGMVLQVLDLETQEPCVLRVLAPTFSAETVTRWLQQSHAMVGLDHPNLIKVRAWEQWSDLVYIVEALPQAPTLETVWSASELPIDPDLAQRLLLDLSRALEYAHHRGAVHGDLQPKNLYVTERGICIGGFGLGRLVEGRDLREGMPLFQDPAYLAPEQILGQPVDVRADLYALGILLYRAFTGKLPFEGPVEAVLDAHLRQAPARPRELNPWLSPIIEHLILKLLSKNPNDRYFNAQQVRRISESLLLREEPVTFEMSWPVESTSPLLGMVECWERGRSGEPGTADPEGRDERVGRPVYYLLAQILRFHLMEVPPELWERQIRRLLNNFMILIPLLGQKLPELPPPPPLAQLRLVGSLLRFVRRAAQERPWFLILDDLQWVDPGCVELLCYLGRHLPEIAGGLLNSPRLGYGGLEHPLRQLLRVLDSEPNYRLLALDRLDEAGVSLLLERLWRQPAPAALSGKIYRHTGGDPFYVEELGKALVDEGYITLKEGRWYFPADLETMMWPDSARETVQYRIGLLPEGTQTLLRQAAVLGQSFYYLDLREISGLSEWELLERLEPALERQLVQEGPLEGQFRFRHFEIHQVLYGEMSQLRRRQLHRQAGEALERRLGKAPGARLEELAYHFGQAVVEAKAIIYGLQSARQAHREQILDTALLWYSRVLERVRAHSEANATLELTIHRALAQVLTVVNRYPEALEHCMAAWKLVAQQSRTMERDQQQAELCYLTALAHEGRSDYGAALEWIRSGLQYLEGHGPTLELAQLDCLWGWVLIRQSNIREALPRLERALETARAQQLRGVESDCLRSLGAVAWQVNEYSQAVDYFEQALQIYRQLGDRLGEGRTLNNLGATAYQQQQYRQAEQFHRQAFPVFYDLGDRTGTGGVLNNLSATAWSQGNFGEARALGEQALRLRLESGDRRGKAEVFNNLGQILMDAGDYAHAREHLEQALEIFHQIGDARGEAAALKNLGLLFLYQRNPETAYTLLSQAAEIVSDLDDWHTTILILLALGRAQATLGLAPEAEATYSQLMAVERLRRQYPNWLLQVRAGLAELYWRRGDRAAALAEVEEILKQLAGSVLNSQDDPFWVYWHAYRLLRLEGDPRAMAVLTEGVALLRARAELMDGPMRRIFLENVAINRELLQWWKEQS